MEWDEDEEDEEEQHNDCEPKSGIVLMIGYLPGVKIGLVPLLRPKTVRGLVILT